MYNNKSYVEKEEVMTCKDRRKKGKVRKKAEESNEVRKRVVEKVELN
jgi:hypothetical protein